MLRSIAALSALVVTASSLGCAPQEEPPPVATAQSPIEGGYLDDFDTHVVGIVRVGNSFGACTGTLVAPNVVLTAQHCVADSSSSGVQCGSTYFGEPHPPDELFVTTKTSFTQNPDDYHATREIHVPPDGSDFCGNDQALMILDEPISPEEAAPAVPRVDEPLVKGEEYYAVGYGAQYDDESAPSGTRHRRDELYTDCVGADCSSFNIDDKELRGDTGICQGDSGGPAIDLLGRVAGVASRGSPGCESPIYGHVHSWGQWIKDSTSYAASLTETEPPAWATGWPTDPAYSHPVGASCEAPEDCPSSACLEGYCTRICDDRAPCPDGYKCRADGFCEQIPEPEPPSNEDDEQVRRTACTVASVGLSSEGKDPTKPIPWEWTLVAAGALALARRRS